VVEAATSAASTGGGARQTAGAMVGVAGGLVGVFAVFFWAVSSEKQRRLAFTLAIGIEDTSALAFEISI
jgi:hypothetical protein